MPRKDLAKAICEDGRRGSRDYMGGRKGYEADHKYHNPEDRDEEYSDLDALPKQEGMKRRLGYDTRSFSENLGPIYGLIKKNVGKNWDKLYSEICRLAPPNGSNIQRHVHQHLLQEIATKTQLCADGTIQVYEYGGWASPEESWFDYYVHPKTGCIVKVKKKVSKYANFKWPGHNPTKLEDVCKMVDDSLFVKIYGIWYVYELQKPMTDTRRVPGKELYTWVIETYVKNPDRLSVDLTLIKERHNKLRQSAGMEPDDIGWDTHLIARAIDLHPGLNACNRKQANGKLLKAVGLSNDKKDI